VAFSQPPIIRFLYLSFDASSNQCNGQNNQRFIFNADYTTLIRVAGTPFCVAAASEYCATLTLISSECSQILFLLAIKDSAAGSAVVLRKCDRTSNEHIWVYETFGNRVALYSQSYLFLFVGTFSPNRILEFASFDSEPKSCAQPPECTEWATTRCSGSKPG
jgi:hypothetical protein